MVLSGSLESLKRALAGNPIALNDGLRVDLHVDKPLSLPEQLRGEDTDRGRAVTDLVVLNLGDVHQDLGRRVVEGDRLEDRSSVVGDGDLTGRGGLCMERRGGERGAWQTNDEREPGVSVAIWWA